jgi:pimeloyl-ACP methyl ester carboxylesterase
MGTMAAARYFRLAGLSPRRRVVAVASVVLAVGLAAALAVPRLVDWVASGGEGGVPPQDRPGPVLLVPGYGGGTASLEQLVGALRAAGRLAIVVGLPGDGTGDLRAQAGTLDAAVDQALENTGSPSVDIVGYSAGGVVARLWVQEHAGQQKARRIVTLGSPHHGARIAGVGAASVPGACPEACQQLVPGSRLLAGLATPVPTPPVWLSVWTVDDETVTPPESARLEGAVDVVLQSVCPAARPGHGGLPADPVVTRIVLDALGSQPLTPPAPGCGLSS